MTKTLIIAEAGVNHNGDMELAKKLIDAAAEAKVDYVKFQTFKADKLVTKTAKRAAYQDKNTADGDSQYEMLKKLELSDEDHELLFAYCKEKNVRFLSTGFDLDSIDYLYSLGVRLAKVPSGEITNLPYLEKVAKTFPDIILSTGMADIQEVHDAYNALINAGANKERITILHCNTEYPTPMEDVNLKAMLHIQKELNVPVGYSDHTLGIEVPIAAVSLSAKVIEKHFTLDRKMQGPDHRASLEPQELIDMVKSIRNIEKALSGSGLKSPSPSETKNKTVARKSIVAKQDIKQGEIFTEENLNIKRPGTGISPMTWYEVLGKKATRDFNTDEIISL
jgi:N,N'-diacetyllegionaminate synthase